MDERLPLILFAEALITFLNVKICSGNMQSYYSHIYRLMAEKDRPPTDVEMPKLLHSLNTKRKTKRNPSTQISPQNAAYTIEPL